jgi:hypothetical protein
MTAWKHRVDLGDLWEAFDAREMTVTKVAGEAAERLRSIDFTCDEWDEALEEMEDLSRSGMNNHENESWFNGIMDALWSVGDDHAIWIDTMGVPA